jgi:hypothetical protein
MKLQHPLKERSQGEPNFSSWFACIGNFWNGRGYVIRRENGEFNKSGGIQGSCSYHRRQLQASLYFLAEGGGC